jgi:hypothetical protein
MKSVKRLLLLIVIFAIGIGVNLYAQVSPTLLSPQNKDSCLTVALDLVWQQVPNALSYKVEVSDVSNFSNILISQSNLQSTTLGIQVSDWDKVFYWRVYAVYTSSEGISLPWSFKTKKAPVNLLFPSDSLTCADTVITFKWNKSDAEFYTLQVAEDSAFTIFRFNVNNLTDTTQKVVLNKYAKQYFWRTAAKKALCQTDWSLVRVVTTKLAPPVHIYPSNGALGAQLFTTAPFNINLKWKKIDLLATYNIQVSKKSDFSIIFFEKSDIADTTINVVIGNEYDSIYYWRVNVTLDGCQSYWSKSTNFKTPYNAPAITSPANDEVCVSLSGNLFKWTTIAKASTYRVQLSETNDFAVILSDVPNIDQNQLNLKLTLPMTKYFWRVRAEDSQNSGLWSIVKDFFSTQRPPKNLVPADSTAGMQKSLKLSWERIGPGNRYDVKIAEDIEFTKVVFDSTLIDTNYVNINMPKNNNEYFWMVRSRFNGCIGDWSLPISFKTILQSPVLLSPANKTVIPTLYPIFKWKQVIDAVTYDIEVSQDSTFTTLFKYERNIPAIEWTFASEKFEEKQTYYWRVRSENTEGRSLWSAFFVFSVSEQPAEPPILLTPENGAVTLPLTTILTWSKVTKAKKYYIEVSKDNNFQDLIVNQELPDTTIGVVGLSRYSNYWWKVRSINDGGSGEWSSVFTFRTKDEAPDEPAVLIFPEDNLQNSPVTFTFKWSKVERALGYELQIATSNQFEQQSIVLSNDKIWSEDKKILKLEFDKTYYWRVRAWNEDGKGPWSAVKSFSTILSSVRDNISVPEATTVYPNPSVKGNTVINFDLNTPGIVNVKIYNILGKPILEIPAKEFNAGNQNIELNTSNFNPGIYFYSLKTANQSYSGRFIISD